MGNYYQRKILLLWGKRNYQNIEDIIDTTLKIFLIVYYFHIQDQEEVMISSSRKLLEGYVMI